MPENTVFVARPSKWGNPFRVTDDRTHRETVGAFRTWLVVDGCHADMPDRKQAILGGLADLRGKNLACWCRLCEAHKDGKPLGVECAGCAPCHADVLLELANMADEAGRE